MDYDYVIVIIPKTRLPSAEPIINQQGFRSCSIAPFFEINTSPSADMSPPAKGGTASLKPHEKAQPEHHGPHLNSMWRMAWLGGWKQEVHRRWAPHLWFAIKNVSGDLRIYVSKIVIFHSYILKVLKGAQYFSLPTLTSVTSHNWADLTARSWFFPSRRRHPTFPAWINGLREGETHVNAMPRLYQVVSIS